MKKLFQKNRGGVGSDPPPRRWRVKDSHYDPLNYRPVSLASICCKTMERIIVKHIHNYHESNGILCDHQFGFRSGRSVMEQLLLVSCLMIYRQMSMRGRQWTWCCSTLQKLLMLCVFFFFNVLLQQLQLLGIDGQLLSWISSFLSEFRQT